MKQLKCHNRFEKTKISRAENIKGSAKIELNLKIKHLDKIFSAIHNKINKTSKNYIHFKLTWPVTFIGYKYPKTKAEPEFSKKGQSVLRASQQAWFWGFKKLAILRE